MHMWLNIEHDCYIRVTALLEYLEWARQSGYLRGVAYNHLFIIYYYYYYLLQVIYKAKQPVTPDQQVKKVQVD